MNNEHDISQETQVTQEVISAPAVESLITEGLLKAELSIQLSKTFSDLVQRVNADKQNWYPDSFGQTGNYLSLPMVELTETTSLSSYFEIPFTEDETLEGTSAWLETAETITLEFEKWSKPLSENPMEDEDPETVPILVTPLDNSGSYKAVFGDGSNVSNEHMKLVIESLDLLSK